MTDDRTGSASPGGRAEQLGALSRDVTAAELLETMADILRQRNVTVDEAIRTTMMGRVDVVALYFGEFLDAM